MYKKVKVLWGAPSENKYEVVPGWLYYNFSNPECFSRGIQIRFEDSSIPPLNIDLEGVAIVRRNDEKYAALLAHEPTADGFGFFGETKKEAVQTFLLHWEKKSRDSDLERQLAMSRLASQE